MTQLNSRMLRLACLSGLLLAAPAAFAADSAAAVEQGECVAEGMQPEWLRAGGDSARQMVRSCLLTASPTADLCEKVPLQGVVDALDQGAWYTKGCATLGLTSQHCQLLMDEVAEYCYANPSS